MSSFTRADHDRVLANYCKPTWLVKSKPDPLFATEYKVDADLSHDYWIVRTEDPAKLRDPEVTFDFTQTIDAHGVQLNDPSLVRDMLTAKLLVIESLRGHYLSPVAAGTAQRLVLSFMWIVRWRLAMGVRHTRELTISLFEDYCTKMGRNGPLGLIPFEDRLERLARSVNEGGWALPSLTNGTKRSYLDMGRIAAELGLPSGAIWGRYRDRLLAVTRQIDSSLVPFGRNARTCASDCALPDDEDASKITGELVQAGAGVSLDSVFGHLVAWQVLYRLTGLRLLDHDRLLFDPFETVSIKHRAEQIGKSSDGRTGTPRPEQWLGLLDGAAKWVLDLSGPLLTILEGARNVHRATGRGSGARGKGAKRANPSQLRWAQEQVAALIAEHWRHDDRSTPSLAPVWRRPTVPGPNARYDASCIPLDEATLHLITACLVLIGAFSARRKKELLSLQAGCVEQDPFGGLWLSSYIEKTVRDIDKLPVPSLVGVAVSLLESLSQSAREASGEPWIIKIQRQSFFEGANIAARAHCNIRPSLLLNEFAKIIDIFPDADGNPWVFATHQLRRGFAVYYYYGNRNASLDALSRFLRHFDPEMTRRYITEVVPGALLQMREEIEARIARAEEIEAAVGAEAPEAREARSAVATAEDAFEHISDVDRVFTEVKDEATTDRMLEVYDGVEAPIGRGAAVLRRELDGLIAEARTRIRLGGRASNGSPDEEREALISQLRRYAPTRNIEPHPGRHAHCGWSPGRNDDLAQAECLKNKAAEAGGPTGDTRPDYAYSSTADCMRCAFGVAFSENQRVVEERAAELGEAATKGPSPGTRTAAQAMLDDLIAGVEVAKAAVRGRA